MGVIDRDEFDESIPVFFRRVGDDVIEEPYTAR